MQKTSKLESLSAEFFTALGFLTVLPVQNFVRRREAALARAMLFFPLTGILIGILSWVSYKLSLVFFPERFSVLLLIAVPVLISGGLHVDGFADFCDGFFGGSDKEETLRIMKDPRIGSWAAVGIALLFLAKFELLAALPQKLPVFLFALSAARWVQVILSFCLPYAGKSGLGQAVAGKVTLREMFGGLVFIFPFIFFLGVQGLLMFATLLMFTGLFGLAVKRKIGGVTGDVLGAASEIAEIVILLAANGGFHV